MLEAKQVLPAWLASLEAVLERAAQAARWQADRFSRAEATTLHGIDECTAPETVPAPGRALSADLRERLRPLVGEASGRLRVHDDEHAHRVASAHGADAVSIGADVYFGHTRYQPNDMRGFALLAHEALHVQHATRPNTQVERASPAARLAEEMSALRLESEVLWGKRFAERPNEPERASAKAHSSNPRAALADTPQIDSPSAHAAHTPAAHQPPMAASSDRALPAPEPPTLDVEELRQTLMRDLLRQIRIEMERGG
jgi:hypothetical protein